MILPQNNRVTSEKEMGETDDVIARFCQEPGIKAPF